MLMALVVCPSAGAQGGQQKPGRIVTHYAITADNDYPSNDPEDWRLLGSNDDGQTWTLLDAELNQTFAERSQRRVFVITNQVAYNTYRLEVSRTFHETKMVEVAELELMGPVVGVVNESALDMAITASMEHPLMGPAFEAFDGDITTKWWDFGLDKDRPAWIQCRYTLGSERTVTNISQLVVTTRRTLIRNPLLDQAGQILSNLTAQATSSGRELTGYALTAAPDAPQRDPRDWRLLGSKDGGKTWDTLDVRLNEIFSARLQRQVFTLTKPVQYPVYRLQIDAVPGGSGADAIQLSELEPLHASNEPPSVAAAYGLVVSAQGENQPWEMIDKAFDGDPTTKWLDFARGRTNKTSWIQWQYLMGLNGVVANLNRLQISAHQSPRPFTLDLNGVVVYANADNDLGILDETGCELLRSSAPVAGVRLGDHVNLKGRLQFGSQHTLVSNPALAALGELPKVAEIRPGQVMPENVPFIRSAVRGRADMVSLGDFYTTVQLTSEAGQEHLLAKIPNPAHRLLGGLSGCRLEVQGVVESVFNQNGKRVAGIVWAGGLDQVRLLPPTDQEQEGWPEFAPTNPAPSDAPWGSLVRVRGTVGGLNPGECYFLAHGTNRLAVEFQPPLDLPLGAAIECAGLLARDGTKPVLLLARYLSGTSDTPEPPSKEGDAEHPITDLHQLCELESRHPDRNYNVKVRGVITYIDDRMGGFYLQNGDDALRVPTQLPAGLSAFIRQEGMYVELTGVAGNNWVSPSDFLTFLGKGSLPEPNRPSYDELMTGRDDDRWVELEGVVISVKAQLVVMVEGREMVVWVNKLDKTMQNNLLGSLVRIRGVCSAVFNNQTQRLGQRLLVPSSDTIEVLRAAPEDPLSQPTMPVGQLMQSASDYAEQTVHIIKTAGVVTYQDAGQFFVQDGAAGVRVVPRQRVKVAPGDRVEVAGLGKADGFSPMLIQATVCKTGQAALPEAKAVDLFEVGSGQQANAVRVAIEATFLASSINGNYLVLEMQHDKPRMVFNAYLPAGEDSRLPFEPGSKIKMTGVFKVKTEAALDYGQLTSSFDIFVNGVSDFVVLQRPPWLTAAHALWILSGLGAVLALALGWAGLLRRQVRARTSELSAEVEQRKRMQEQVEKTHNELMVASRQAGMAEVATNVLHNVGNTLNSVNISASVIVEKLQNIKSDNLSKVVSLLRDHLADISGFLTTDPKGRTVLGYLDQLAEHLKKQQAGALGEVQHLVKNIEHIKAVVSMQQNFVKAPGLIETFRVNEVVEDALQMNAEALVRHHLAIIRDFDPVPCLVSTDRHKVLQVLINLIQNAKQACEERGGPDQRITLRVRREDGRALISVADNGIGVAPENMERIYVYGFTTRKNGHGFGLHSSALAAQEMGGTLRAQSDGVGKGATFTLELPLGETPPPMFATD